MQGRPSDGRAGAPSLAEALARHRRCTHFFVSSVRVPEVLPVLPMRDTVVYPEMAAPLLVGQPRSLEVLRDVARLDPEQRLVALVAQRDPEQLATQPEELHRIGTVALLREMARTEKVVRVVVLGIERMRLGDPVRTHPYLVARVHVQPDATNEGVELEALMRTVKELFVSLVRISAELSDDLVLAAEKTVEARTLAYLVASAMPLPRRSGRRSSRRILCR
jgi:ATP-dependent Lon protease